MAIIVGFGAFLSIMIGGLLGIRFKDKLHLILGFSAGAVLGVTLFDLIPESFELAHDVYGEGVVTAMFALGFILYMILDRFAAIHPHCHGEHCDNESHSGQIGAAALCFHTFLDGLAIGLAFKIDSTIGWVVATAVLVHGFSDGINTVNMILKGKGGDRASFRWLIADALAPIAGAMTATFIAVTDSALGLILAIFAGLFLYIGASELIPESHHRHPAFLTTAMTIFGMAVIFIAVRLVHG